MNDFARQIGVSACYWSRIERNLENPPKDAMIFKASEILGVSSDNAFSAANRLPPDMREHLGDVVRMYRKSFPSIAA